MKRPISILSIMIVGVMSAVPSDGVQMTAQIRRLLDQKEEKIKQLEACEGKKRGWMIAGISTIGLTAVGVGVNIAQASKSNKLSSEIDIQKQTLERQQNRLAQIQQNNSAAPQDSTEKKEETVSKEEPLNVSVNGIDWGYYEIDGSAKDVDGCAVSNAGEWCVVFPDDVVIKGQAVCSDTPGEYNEASSSEQINSNGPNCWCKMTQPSGSRWVFEFDYSSYCAYNCASSCAGSAMHVTGFREALFGAQ